MTEPNIVQPSPVPTTFQVAPVTDNNTGKMLTMLTILTPSGKTVVFIDSDTAKLIGDTLLKSAIATAGSGLVVANGVLPQ